MDEEKWFNAEEAKEYGFIDEIVGEMEKPQNVNNLLIVNSLAFDISKFKNFPNSRPAVSPKNIKDEMTVEKFINSYPEIYQEILNQGIISERKRIQEIEDLDVAGYDEIINTAKFNEPIDAANLALKILNLKKLKNKNTLENIITESQATAIPVAPLKDESSGAVAGISVTNILKYMNKKTGGK